MPLVSVIITTFNSAKTIERLLNSVYSQEGIGSLFELEVIIVDDCSQDNTLEVISSFNSIVLKTDVNSGGPNNGRNIALKVCKGDFICIADHDDEWINTKIKDQLEASKKADIITCGYYLEYLDRKESKIVVEQSENSVILHKKNQTFLTKLQKLKTKQVFYLGGLMFSSKFKNIFFEETFGCVDYDWNLRLYENQKTVAVCKPLFKRFVDTSNLSLNLNYRRKDFYYSLYTLEYFEEKYPAECRLARQNIFGSRARFHYSLGEMAKARYYFLHSKLNLKTLLYLITSFVGYQYVVKKVRVFG